MPLPTTPLLNGRVGRGEKEWNKGRGGGGDKKNTIKR